jgi:hypothetical protein
MFVDDPPLDQNTQMAFKKKEWFEVFDCTSENWVVRRLDGAVGRESPCLDLNVKWHSDLTCDNN